VESDGVVGMELTFGPWCVDGEVDRSKAPVSSRGLTTGVVSCRSLKWRCIDSRCGGGLSCICSMLLLGVSQIWLVVSVGLMVGLHVSLDGTTLSVCSWLCVVGRIQFPLGHSC
jgi:hypothetical protein